MCGRRCVRNIIYAQQGATVVAHERCLLELMEKGPRAFREEVLSRAAMRDKKLTNPSLLFPDKLVFDDGVRRVELLYNGHAHTSGDAVVTSFKLNTFEFLKTLKSPAA